MLSKTVTCVNYKPEPRQNETSTTSRYQHTPNHFYRVPRQSQWAARWIKPFILPSSSSGMFASPHLCATRPTR